MTKRNAIPLDAITTIATEDECAPEAGRLTRKDVNTLWAQIEALYHTGMFPAVSVVLRRRGKIVLKRAIGHARGNGPGETGVPQVLATPDTPICLFSASKAVTALMVHKLAETGLVSLDNPIAEYLPEYAQQGKTWTTVRQLLAHRAGIPSMTVKNAWEGQIYDFDSAVQALCAARSQNNDDRTLAYHALSGGYILGEILRRATGRELNELLREWFAEPLGCRYFTFGLPLQHRSAVATNYCTGPKTWVVEAIVKRTLGGRSERICEISNDERFLSAVIPAANMHATADEIGRFYQMLLDGGEYQGQRILKADTVAEAIRPYGKRQILRGLWVPMRYSAGLMLGERGINWIGTNNPQAYGHAGYQQIQCWADPERDISVSILTTGKVLPSAGAVPMIRLLGAINRICAPLAR